MASSDKTRARNWAFVAYPENITEAKLTSVLNDLHIQWALSPLHDQDFDPDGEAKKPHWHVLLTFSGNKSYDQICEITKSCGGTIPIVVQSVRSMVRYFAHLDNPDKFQYNKDDIKFYGGLNPSDVLPLSSMERYRIVKDMCLFIVENKVTNFSSFVTYCITERYEDWFPVLCDHSCMIVKETIKGMWFTEGQGSSTKS